MWPFAAHTASHTKVPNSGLCRDDSIDLEGKVTRAQQLRNTNTASNHQIGISYSFPSQTAPRKSSAWVNLKSGNSSFHSFEISQAPLVLLSSIPMETAFKRDDACSSETALWTASRFQDVLRSPASRSLIETLSMLNGSPK